MDLTKDFFYSYSYNIMLSLQKNLSDHNVTGQLLYETLFVWNEFLTRGIRNNLQNTSWTVALVYGFFKQVHTNSSFFYVFFFVCVKQNCTVLQLLSQYFLPLFWCLLLDKCSFHGIICRFNFLHLAVSSTSFSLLGVQGTMLVPGLYFSLAFLGFVMKIILHSISHIFTYDPGLMAGCHSLPVFLSTSIHKSHKLGDFVTMILSLMNFLLLLI
jgi:hypothetical protein